MRGAIIGDIVGSAYEFGNISTKDFPLFSGQSRFTDDTVMTCAVAKVLTDCRKSGEKLTAEKIVSVMQGFEDCIRNCISVGGDSDTIAAIAGGIAEAYYGVLDSIWKEAEEFLDDELKEIVREMYEYKPLTVSYEQFEALVKKDYERDLSSDAPEQRDRYFYGSEAQTYLRQEYESYYRKYHGFDIGRRQFRDYAVNTVSFCLSWMYE